MDTGADSRSDVASHIAETARVYDSLPYSSKAIFRTHPARLAAVARLYGLDPVPPARARVLELGCAAGGNLIPLAERYPEAHFLGIDLGQVMIEDGQARIAALGLENVELRVESITDLPADAGPFDYIVCHGVYSWVPAPVRDKILEICGRHLSPNGIAYISYNVLPGWRTFQSVRDAMRILPTDVGEVERAKQGRGLLNFLAQTTPHKGAWGDFLRRMPLQIGADDAYLFHEYLEPVNEPCLFVDFVGDAARHGLGYLGESELTVMFPQGHGDEFARKLDAVTEDIVQQQQMLDILVGTSFRTSLLVRQSTAEHIDRAGAGQRLGALFLAQSAIYQYKRTPEGKAELSSRGDVAEFTFEDPAAVALLDRLFEDIPRAWSLEGLVEGIDIDEGLYSNLLSVMIANSIVVPMTDPLAAAAVSERPFADIVVRDDAGRARSDTTNRLHMPVALNGAFHFLLPYLDGTRSHDDLVELTIAEAQAGRINLQRDGQVPAPEDLAEAAREMVMANLQAIAELGLLSG